MDLKDHIRGALYGAAIGDALGRPTEFMKVSDIIKRWGKYGPDLPTPAIVTDDTQMMLAVGRAVTSADLDNITATGTALRREIVAWYCDPKSIDGQRAPGGTCLSAAKSLLAGKPWRQATHWNKKGCGANMRVQPVGLLPIRPAQMDRLAELQSVLTHGHPTALMASRLTAATVARCLEGHPWDMIVSAMQEATREPVFYLPTSGYRLVATKRAQEEIRPLLHRLGSIAEGWREDPCAQTGDGWVAEQAYATAMNCCLRFPEDPEMALRRAAVTRGDSDSLACLTGSFMGARYGMRAWPAPWVERIEYREELEDLAEKILALWVDAPVNRM